MFAGDLPAGVFFITTSRMPAPMVAVSIQVVNHFAYKHILCFARAEKPPCKRGGRSAACSILRIGLDEEREEIDQDARCQTSATAQKEDHECDGAFRQEADSLDEQAENHQQARQLDPPFESILPQHHRPPSQNFSLSCCAMLCTFSWQPLETHEILLALMSGRSDGSALWTAPSSNFRAPR